MHLGDFDLSAVIYGKFTTYRPSTGATFTLGGTPALSVYKDNSVTQSTTGVTLTADFDAVTGLNHFAIDTSADGTFYSAGSFFDIVITTGTVDSVSVTGSVVGRFTIRKNSALKPTTAGRALDVSAGGEAGVDWANVGSPTTALALTGTTIATTQKVDVETIKTQAVTAAAPVTVLTSVGTAATSTAQTGDSFARIGALGAGLTAVGDTAGTTTLLSRLSALRAGYLDNLSAGAVALASGVNVTQWLGSTPNALIAGRLDVNLQAGATGVVSASLLAADAANEIADALLDRADAIETGETPRMAWRHALAALAGVLSGAATTTVVIKGAGVATTRITATVDADGNRSAVVLA